MKRIQRLWQLSLALLLLLGMLPVAAAQGGFQVAEQFRAYYDQHEGMRVLGYPLSEVLQVNGYLAQFFEKGRIEDHRRQVADPAWAFMYGRLTAELMERDPQSMVNNTSISYGVLKRFFEPKQRHAPPAGFTGGTQSVKDGIFVPFSATLKPAPGYVVAPYFWAYITRADLFPGGWLHDIGLPMSDIFTADTLKNGQIRTIVMQSFERTVLSYDPLNPAGWQVERGNIGADALRALFKSGTIEQPPSGARVLLPLHLLARADHPGEQLFATLRWQDGTHLTQAFTTLRGEDGIGLLIGNLDWSVKEDPPAHWTQPATLEVSNQLGTVLARQELLMFDQNDPSTQALSLYWVAGAELVATQRRILSSERLPEAALKELLWGPGPRDNHALTTALPTPEEVLAYSGREAGWGPRVRLLGLTLEHGIATANFSQELMAYGGTAPRAQLIAAQITRTLLQFPGITEVRIAIEGKSEGGLLPVFQPHQ